MHVSVRAESEVMLEVWLLTVVESPLTVVESLVTVAAVGRALTWVCKAAIALFRLVKLAFMSPALMVRRVFDDGGQADTYLSEGLKSENDPWIRKNRRIADITSVKVRCIVVVDPAE